MLQLRDTFVDVPSGWNFVVKETNERLHASTFDDLVYRVHQHMTINKIDIPHNLGDIIENDICTRIPKHMIKGDL